ncbi:uncharacterized protein LOC124183139 [Neodiprion fabricii]|uniref:uncharacterized protein LOC124183139 n=1 Tax=Neodiprion fabricii TaxID=2872261 RepID=UPI001ED8C4AA|nr:uncharacterized protein LOC124183139 [Neodiprion fabricii]
MPDGTHTYSAGDEIISKKSLIAVKESINFLKQHSREEGLFRRVGRRDVRRRILSAMTRGEKPQLGDINGAALECAAALQLFLSRLKVPVMPRNVQQLILAENPGVSPRTVARDALGLIRQDVNGRHGELLCDLLGLLRHLTLAAPPSECSELRGSPLPVALLPVFFALTPADLVKWRQVAARFSELINEAPARLRLNYNETFHPARDSSVDPTEVEGSRMRGEVDRLSGNRDLSLCYPVTGLAGERNVCSSVTIRKEHDPGQRGAMRRVQEPAFSS